MAGVASEREFAEGDTLMSEGDFGYSLFVVEEGSADVVAHAEKVTAIGPPPWSRRQWCPEPAGCLGSIALERQTRRDVLLHPACRPRDLCQPGFGI